MYQNEDCLYFSVGLCEMTCKLKCKYKIKFRCICFGLKLLKCFRMERVLQFVKYISSESCTEQFKIIQALQMSQSASIWTLSGFQECTMHRNLRLLKMLFEKEKKKKKSPYVQKSGHVQTLRNKLM